MNIKMATNAQLLTTESKKPLLYEMLKGTI